MIERLHRWGGLLADVIYPRDCLHCGELVDSSECEYLCVRCEARLDWIQGNFCDSCGYPYVGIGANQSCSHCELLNPAFERGRCCLLHREVGASLVKALKYHRGRYVKGDLQRIAKKVPGLDAFVRGTVLVPVPLNRTRERERGFNQSLFIARAWAEVLPVVGVEPILERVRWTGTQTQLERKERMRNVKNAFRLKENTSLIADLTYTIIDDVFTTGSTLNECSRVLRANGVQHLRVLALAHG